MQKVRDIMGMPIRIVIADRDLPDAQREAAFQAAFDEFVRVDRRYSTYKPASEVSQINAGLPRHEWSAEVRQVLQLCEDTKQETDGYFDIEHEGKIDPSGLVKGWAIQRVAALLQKRGIKDFYIDAGGDIQAHGRNGQGELWQFGIRSPFNRGEIVKVAAVSGQGLATSGTYVRGQHIYNPHTGYAAPPDIASLTVIGPNIYEADRFATAAFAMGQKGIKFIDSLEGFEGYMIDATGLATLTQGFERYVV